MYTSDVLTRVIYDVSGHLLRSDIARDGDLLGTRRHK